MESIFAFEDYKGFVNAWVARQPSKGRGALQKIAKALRVHPTLVSQIFRGPKNLTLEQAASLTRYLSLASLDTEYFLALVQKARAGNAELREALDVQLESLQARAGDLINRVHTDGKLGPEAKQVFYSNWHYSAIRLATSVDGLSSSHKISSYLGLSPELVENALGFLVANGLCARDGAKYSLGPAITHLESSSDLLPRHHSNWRLKAQARHPFLSDRELAFSGPLSISRDDADEFRERLVTLIKDLGSKVKDSKAEELRCFNMDWFLLGPEARSGK